tara:strand:- start:1771 stop:2583 length:813 start_codon:yes stop_codon:yes gene_type:complete
MDFETIKSQHMNIGLIPANGLPTYSERWIRSRRQIQRNFEIEILNMLIDLNPQAQHFMIESPCLVTRDMVNENYTNQDMFVQYSNENEQLVLRPETTPASYAYAKKLLGTNRQSNVKPPLVVYQTNKSFRRETDHVVKNMRLKEFYQLEFQFIYSADTKNDYHARVLENILNVFNRAIPAIDCHTIPSDRLPSYSEKTTDVETHIQSQEFKVPDSLELCSISTRTDFNHPYSFHYTNKKGEKIEKPIDFKVLEIAIGLDRCVFAHLMSIP